MLDKYFDYQQRTVLNEGHIEYTGVKLRRRIGKFPKRTTFKAAVVSGNRLTLYGRKTHRFKIHFKFEATDD